MIEDDVKEITLGIGEIKPYAMNNKIHSEKNIGEIAKSIEEFGYLSKVGVDENNVILYGEGRFYALQKLGYKEIVVQKVSHLTEEKKRAFRIIDNKLANNSVYDVANIEKEIQWLLENNFQSDSKVLGIDFSGDFDGMEDTLDEALEESFQTTMDEVFERSGGTAPKPLEKIEYENMFFDEGCVIEYGSIIIHNKKIETGLDGIYIIDSDVVKKPPEHSMVFIRKNYKLLDKTKNILVWHKGSACSCAADYVMNDNLEIIALLGDFTKRRFNNLLTAIPSINEPSIPPVHLFDDILQNFIPSKRIYSNFHLLGVSAITNKKEATLYIEQHSDINELLRTIRQVHSPKIKCTCKINGQEVHF
jgi:hypothetical protein